MFVRCVSRFVRPIQPEAGSLYYTSAKQITNWVHRFEKEDIEGLKDKEGQGRTSRLSNEPKDGLKKFEVICHYLQLKLLT